MSPCRLLIDVPLDGARNMAIDEALLQSTGNTGVASLRFYAWSQPTLSLGYFQSVADRQAHDASGACPMVRRRSGGGAILHDVELTYSFATPERVVSDRHSRQMYFAFHETLAEVLAEFGWNATLAIGDASRNNHFLCFQRRAEGDLLLGGAKICGSAQRRRRNALLQHGSILLHTSPFAPELPGILDSPKSDAPAEKSWVGLADTTQSSHSLIFAWLDRLAWRLKLRPFESQLTDKEERAAEEAVGQMFGSKTWNDRR